MSKTYSPGEFYSLFESIISSKDRELPPKIEKKTKENCIHEWVVVGYGLNGNKYINCKHCDMAQEDWEEEQKNKKPTIKRDSYNFLFWD